MAGTQPLLAVHPQTLALILGGSGRAKMVWALLRQGQDPFTSTALGKKTQGLLQQYCHQTQIECVRIAGSAQTQKMQLRLHDGACVETVIISEQQRSTVCLSTQVGCAHGCIFCQTATMGLVRQLTTDEIVGQVVAAQGVVTERGLPALRNVVLMGMGEPLDNYASVLTSLDILTEPNAFALAPKHVTLSTVAPSPKAVLQLMGQQVKIAWSLHSADDEQRKQLIKAARHDVVSLRNAFAEVLYRPKATLFVEVVLLGGVNDSRKHAARIGDLLSPLLPGVRINLLPMNPGRENLIAASHLSAVAFRQVLRQQGYFCNIRSSHGLESQAACGQLVTG